jgi:hypothetical protein
MAGGGRTGALMRAHDWAATPLGAPDAWPASLKTAVGLVLAIDQPMYLFWGPERACLHNDAWARSFGPDHAPGSALGRPAREVWAQAWDVLGPRLDRVLSGLDAGRHEEALLPVPFQAGGDDVRWTCRYSPIHGEAAAAAAAAGGASGVLVVFREPTGDERAENGPGPQAGVVAAEPERAWHERTAQLQGLAAELATARTPRAAALATLAAGVRALGAPRGSVFGLADDGAFVELVAAIATRPDCSIASAACPSTRRCRTPKRSAPAAPW